MTLKCSLCASQNVRPDRRGIFKCENGHLVTVLEDELNEYDGSYGALRKLSRQQNLGKRRENVERKILLYHQNVLTKVVRLSIHEFHFPPQVELYLRNLWTLFLMRSYSILYADIISKATIRENFDLSSSFALFILAIYEFSIPISELTILKLLMTYLKEAGLIVTFDISGIPSFLKDLLTTFDFTLCLKKVDSYNHTLLGRPMGQSRTTQILSAWNVLADSHIPYYSISIKLLNKFDFDGLFWLLLNSFHTKFDDGICFWSAETNESPQQSNRNFRYIKIYPRYCSHYLHCLVHFLSTTLKIGLINKHFDC